MEDDVQTDGGHVVLRGPGVGSGYSYIDFSEVNQGTGDLYQALLEHAVNQPHLSNYEPMTVRNRSNQLAYQNLEVHDDDSDSEEEQEQQQRRQQTRNYRSPKTAIYTNIMRQTEMFFYQLEPDLFVKRRACDPAKELLLRYNVVTIIGNSGDGRSCLGLWLLKTLSEELDCDAIRLTSPKDWYRILDVSPNSPEKFVVMMDDIFGCVGLADFLFEEWQQYIKYIWGSVESGRVFLVLSSKKHLYSQGVNKMPRFDNKLFQKNHLIDLTKDEFVLTWEEKKELLRKQLRRYCLDEDIATNLPKDSPTIGFPLLCNQFCTIKDFQPWGLRFFINPLLWYCRDLEAVSAGEKEIFGILVFMLMSGGTFNPDDFNPFHDDGSKYKEQKKLLRYTSLSTEFPSARLAQLAEHIDSVFIKWDPKARVYRFINKEIKEASLLVFGKYHEREVCRICTLEFLNEYVVTNHYEPKDVEKDVLLILTPGWFDCLAERIILEITSGNISKIIPHRAFSDNNFVVFFFKQLKEKENFQDILNAKDTKEEHSFLYIATMFGQESVVREICLSGEYKKISDQKWAKDEQEKTVKFAQEHKLDTILMWLKKL